MLGLPVFLLLLRVDHLPHWSHLKTMALAEVSEVAVIFEDKAISPSANRSTALPLDHRWWIQTEVQCSAKVLVARVA